MHKVLLSTVAFAALTAFAAPAFAANRTDSKPISDATTEAAAADTDAVATTKGNTVKDKITTASKTKVLPEPYHGKTLEAGKSNVAYVDQVGDSNTAEQTQTGAKGNVSVISQRKNSNIAKVTQTSGTSRTGGNLSVVDQSSTYGSQYGSIAHNSATVEQTGDANAAALKQDGWKITTTQTQTGHGNEAFAYSFGDWQYVTQTQQGDDNYSSVNQKNNYGASSSIANRATTEQVGNGNAAHISQSAADISGDTMKATAKQTGDGNRSVQLQTNRRNTATITQNNYGYGPVGNHASQVQVGTDAIADIEQKNGFGNVASQVQTGYIGGTKVANGGEAYIDQSGSLNAAFQVQSGIGIVTIEQTGNSNFAAQTQSGNSTAETFQTSSSNFALQAQSGGDGNFATVSQSVGNGNRSYQTQIGSSNYSTVAQIGALNQSSTRQEGNSHYASVRQDGNSNKSTVVQK
jgi:hypothetical protein